MAQLKSGSPLEKCDDIYSHKGTALVRAYDEWAEDYNKDLDSIGYNTPSQIAPVLLKYILKDVTVIDIGCGTGLVGDCLRKQGFTGKLDGLDGSQKMVEVAKGKSIYDDLFVQFLVPGEAIKAEAGTKYNGLICVGSITKNHLDPRIVVDFLDILEQGGVMTFGVRDASYNQELLEELVPILKELKDAKKVAELETTTVVGGLHADKIDFENMPKALSNIKPGDYTGNGGTKVFCYKKL